MDFNGRQLYTICTVDCAARDRDKEPSGRGFAFTENFWMTDKVRDVRYREGE